MIDRNYAAWHVLIIRCSISHQSTAKVCCFEAMTTLAATSQRCRKHCAVSNWKTIHICRFLLLCKYSSCASMLFAVRWQPLVELLHHGASCGLLSIRQLCTTTCQRRSELSLSFSYVVTPKFFHADRIVNDQQNMEVYCND